MPSGPQTLEPLTHSWGQAGSGSLLPRHQLLRDKPGAEVEERWRKEIGVGCDVSETVSRRGRFQAWLWRQWRWRVLQETPRGECVFLCFLGVGEGSRKNFSRTTGFLVCMQRYLWCNCSLFSLDWGKDLERTSRA